MNIFDSIISQKACSFRDMASGAELLSAVVVKSVNIRVSSDPLYHVMEDGSIMIDTRVVLPIVIRMDLFCPNFAALTQLNAAILNRETLYEIATRGLVFRSLKLRSGVASQTPEVLSATPFSVEFYQNLVENIRPVTFALPGDSAIIERGIVLIESAKESVQEVSNAISQVLS